MINDSHVSRYMHMNAAIKCRDCAAVEETNEHSDANAVLRLRAQRSEPGIVHHIFHSYEPNITVAQPVHHFLRWAVPRFPCVVAG